MAIDEEVLEDKIALSVLYFKGNEYRKALNSYNELIEEISQIPSSTVRRIRKQCYGLSETPLIGPIVHPKLGSLLDQRAATYEKLGDLKKALKDAETLVKTEPIGCKGYLRSGKILTLMNRELDAYKSYQKGIYTIEKAIEKYQIKVPEVLFQNMKKHYSTLNSRLKAQRNPPILNNTKTDTLERKPKSKSSRGLQSKLEALLPLKRTSSESTVSVSGRSVQPKLRKKDFFSVFSYEIIASIFQHLSIKEILVCHLVSKNWYATLTEIPFLYNNKIHFKEGITANEFTTGMDLIRRVIVKSNSRQIKSLKIRSTQNTQHLPRMLYLLSTEKNLRITKLDIINKNLSIELLAYLFDKVSWKVSNFSQVAHLRLGIKSSIRYENMILKIMPNLKSLEIVVIDKQMSSANKDLLINNSTMQKLTSDTNTPVTVLESLSIINNPKLKCENGFGRGNEETFNPYPIFMNKSFPELVKLVIVSYDLSNHLQLFGQFLSKTPSLKSIYLENNDNFTFLNFCEILCSYLPSFSLDSLTIRDNAVTKEVHFNQFLEDDLYQLHNLNTLDLQGCSISTRGLKKLLKICNTNKRLSTLNLGNSNYIYFKNDKISVRIPKINLYEILEIASGLQRLYLNDMELDSASMKFFNQDIKNKIGIEHCNLKLLDLSFCSQIDGIGLMNLFDAYSMSGSQDFQSFFKLDYLVIDGLEINKSTLRFLTKKGYVKFIQNNILKKKWKQYGFNTLVPDM